MEAGEAVTGNLGVYPRRPHELRAPTREPWQGEPGRGSEQTSHPEGLSLSKGV